MLADGITPDEILLVHQGLRPEGIPEALRFAADVVQQATQQAALDLRRQVDASGKRPVVSATNIKVSQIASEAEHLGMTPDEIVEAHPHLTLAYYYDHQAALRLGGSFETSEANHDGCPVTSRACASSYLERMNP